MQTSSLVRVTHAGDWHKAYDPPLVWSMCRPCGIWFRACPAIAAIRARLLTAASCVPARSA